MMAMKGSGNLKKVSQSSGRLYARLVTQIATDPGERQHHQTASHHDPESEEREDHRRPVLLRDAVEPCFRSGETVGIDQAAEGRGQRDREKVAPVLHVGPGEQHFRAWLLLVPASLDGGP